MSTTESTLEDAPVRAAKTRSGARLLFWLAAGIPLAGCLLSFPLVCSSWFMAYADKYGLTAQRAIFETINKPCDVLMFGDSTAIVGLDPRVVSGVTHLSACNIGITLASLQVLGTAPLDEYLARNPRPKFLVFQYNVDFIQPVPTGNPKDEAIEGIIPLFRYGRPLEGLRHMLRSPDTFIWLVHYTYVVGGLDLRSRFIKKSYPLQAKELGAYTVMPYPGLTECPAEFDPKPVDAVKIAWLRHLREKYADKADHVVVNVAPTSDCNKYRDQWQSSLKGEIDNDVAIYPLHDFVDPHFHVTREGAVRFSQATGEELLRIEGGAGK